MAVESPNEEEKQWWRFGRDTADRYEKMPFPIDGMPTGFEQYFEEQVAIGELAEVSDFKKTLFLEPAREAFHELRARRELEADARRAQEVAARLGF